MSSSNNDDRDPNAPNLANLRALRPTLRKAARDIAQGQIQGKGQRVALPPRPKSVCNVCGKGFDFTRGGEDIVLKHDSPCPECSDKLKEGFTAFVCGNRFCFASSSKLQDMASKIVPVGEHVIDALEGKFKIETKFKPPETPGEKQE